MEEKECMWINKSFGEGFYICDGMLKPVTKEDCENCKERLCNDV